MDTILFSSFAVVYFILLIFSFGIYKNYHVISSLILVPVLFGLVYDNSVIALGRYIGKGQLLEGMNLLRFWFHAFFTPLLVLFSWKTLEQPDVKWAKKAWLRILAFLITISLILVELYSQVFGLDLQPQWEYGVLTYGSSESSGGPPVMVLVVSIVLLATSIIIWRKQKWFWFFLGSLVMTVGSAVEIPIESGAVTNLFELALMISLLATASFQGKNKET